MKFKIYKASDYKYIDYLDIENFEELEKFCRKNNFCEVIINFDYCFNKDFMKCTSNEPSITIYDDYIE